MRKRIFALIVPMLLLLTLSAQAAATPIAQNSLSLSFDGTTAVCSVSYRSDNIADKVSATLTLYQGSTYVDSWSDSGTWQVFVSGRCKVERGKSYKLVLTYSINGVAQPSKTETKTCP